MKRLLILTQVALLALTLQAQEKRLALVVGNSAYEYGGILKNPVNDAMAMEKALSEIGFEVLAHYNLDQGELKKAIDDFGEKLWRYDVGLFFFAGHGIQVNGFNYLIPVDANLLSERHVEYDCVPADRVLANMDESESQVNIMILDACRNNPFERSWNRSASGKGLAFMNAPGGTLIAYATAPGSTASDGEGLNGIYTAALLENIRVPDITVIQVFQNVRSLVSEQTRSRQIPWESTSLTGDFYFNLQRQIQPALSSDTISGSKQQGVTIQQSAPVQPRVPNSNDIDRSATSGLFLDLRDSSEYKWVKIGEQFWMAENLHFEFEGGWCIDSIYGNYYNWETAKEVCPEGWHLPSDEEWLELEKFLGITESHLDRYTWRGTDAGAKLKAKGYTYWAQPAMIIEIGISEDVTNETGFSALPAGICHRSATSRVGREAYFWTSSREDFVGPISRRLHYTRNSISRDGLLANNWGMSVRCIKD